MRLIFDRVPKALAAKIIGAACKFVKTNGDNKATIQMLSAKAISKADGRNMKVEVRYNGGRIVPEIEDILRKYMTFVGAKFIGSGMDMDSGVRDMQFYVPPAKVKGWSMSHSKRVSARLPERKK